MTKMTANAKAELRANLMKTADKEQSPFRILGNLCNAMYKSQFKDPTALVFAQMVGAPKSEERNAFIAKVIMAGDYIIPFGKQNPMAIVWREVDADKVGDYKTVFCRYHIEGEEDMQIQQGCQAIRKTKSVKVMKEVDYVHESGYAEKIQIAVKDKDGNDVMEEVEKFYVPVTKSDWGYKHFVDLMMTVFESEE